MCLLAAMCSRVQAMHVHFVSATFRTSGCLSYETRCRDPTAFVEEEREENVAGPMLLVVADNISVYDNG